MKKYPEHRIMVPRFNEANGFYTTKKKSGQMAKIKSRDTVPELKLKKALWGLGYRYRKNVKKLPGTPDIVYAKFKLAIFVDGEFWHGFNWDEKRSRIKTNRDFWVPKIERNMQRDSEINLKLSREGWTVIRFWETEIKNDLENCLNRVIDYFKQKS